MEQVIADIRRSDRDENEGVRAGGRMMSAVVTSPYGCLQSTAQSFRNRELPANHNYQRFVDAPNCWLGVHCYSYERNWLSENGSMCAVRKSESINHHSPFELRGEILAFSPKYLGPFRYFRS